MTFVVLTHVSHKQFNGAYYAYGPYVKEMNLWLQYADKVLVLAPVSYNKHPDEIDLHYHHPAIELIAVHSFNLLGFSSKLYSGIVIPSIFWKSIKAFRKADHIHLRCPGNMGLLGWIAQIFFPGKIKTAKYAGNWDHQSKQPWSYRLQRWILNNRFLTRNMRVLVYGKWPESTKNIIPFFAATYREADCVAVNPREFLGPLRLMFVGMLSRSKQPLMSCMTVKELLAKEIDVSLDIFGEGPERERIEGFILENKMDKNIHLHGNQKGEVLKTAYQQAHFLVFISESEGWPKAVAEAMWWGCLPITTPVSCVPEMLGYGERGDLVNPDTKEIVNAIEYHINHPDEYKAKCKDAMEWSRQYTLERFEKQLRGLMQS